MLEHSLDLLGFAFIAMIATLIVSRFLRMRIGASLSAAAWVALIGTTLLSIGLAYNAGEAERRRLVAAVSGLTPTYASELDNAGLSMITAKTQADDPIYLALIQRQIEWLQLNPSVADIYTYGHNGDGQIVLLVDSETDYDHSGAIDADREHRTTIGEPYADEDGQIALTFSTGRPQFNDVPYTDRWGTWVSALHPLQSPDGTVWAVLGVDFPAADWISSILRLRVSILALGGVVVGAILVFSVMMCRLRAEIELRKESEAAKDLLQSRLIAASRQAGMAEIATGVLHNIGNVLNSVNVSARLIGDRLRNTRLPGLVKSVELLRQQGDALPTFFSSDARARQLPGYLDKLSQTLIAENTEMAAELAQLCKGIEHISEVVRMQQTCATNSTLMAACLPAEIMDEALRVNLMAVERHNIEVRTQYQELGPRMLDKHKLLQILINLINNAKKATCGPAVARPQVTLTVRATEDGRSVEFQVRDNGAGIDPANLTRIFQHGFTTRPDGHGFGLHSAANAAREMSGSITVHSDGPGQGAIFTLCVPAPLPNEEKTKVAA